MLSFSVLRCMSEQRNDNHFAGGQAETQGLLASCWIIHVCPSLATSQMQMCTCSNEKQAPCRKNKLVTQIYNIHYEQESTHSSFARGQNCLGCSWPTPHRSIFFWRFRVHAGQHKNVDNTLLINRNSPLEEQGETQGLQNDSESTAKWPTALL